MNHDWAETQLFAPRAKARGVGIRNSRRTSRPHSRTGGKNLQCVCAQAVRDFKGAGNVACNRSVDSDAGAAVFPGWNFRWGKRFRAVLVCGVKSQNKSVVVFRHYLRVSGILKEQSW